MMKILFIGNSYTYYNDLPEMFQALCRANGKDVTVHSLTVGGRRLFENLDPRDEKRAELTAFLADCRPDVLFLQEQSVLPAVDFDLFFQGIKGLCDLVGADKTFLYATWGRKYGHVLTDNGWTTQHMTRLLFDAYTQAAEKIGGCVSPVGLCFGEMNQRHPEVELYDPDGSHPSLYGSVLATVCHYYAVFGEFPSICDGLGVESEAVDFMRTCIQTVFEKEA